MRINFLSVQISDVLGNPLTAAVRYSYRLTAGTFTHGPFDTANGSAFRIEELVHEVSLSLSHDEFATQEVRIFVDGPQVEWTNRNCAVTRQGNDVDVAVTMTRVRQAPCVRVPDELAADARANPDDSVRAAAKRRNLNFQDYERGIWLDPAEKQSPPERYVGIQSAFRPRTVRTLKDVDGTALKDPTQDGWERFHFEEKEVELENEGGFLWLEYGAVDTQQRRPRFLIGVWAPKPERENPQSLDFIVNFGHSPTAWKLPGTPFPFQDGYPYPTKGAKDFQPGSPQPYVHVGLSYFFEAANFAFFFAHQAVAAGKPPLIVMPIWPLVSGDRQDLQFEPFQSRSGLHRLLLEVIRYLHQLGYGAPGIGFSEWQGRSAEVNGLALPQREKRWQAPQPAPALGNVAVAGHSSGMAPTSALLANHDLVGGTAFPPSVFGGDARAFDARWRELWDLDLSFVGTVTREKYQELLLAWIGGGSDRRLRLYHSTHTASAANFDTLKKAKRIGWQKFVKVGPPQAEDWRSADGRACAFFFSDGFVTAKQRDTAVPALPPPGDQWWRFHQAAMLLGFGHAARLRLAGP